MMKIIIKRIVMKLIKKNFFFHMYHIVHGLFIVTTYTTGK